MAGIKSGHDDGGDSAMTRGACRFRHCAGSRGYTQELLIDGVVIAGAALMHALIKAGAATLSF